MYICINIYLFTMSPTNRPPQAKRAETDPRYGSITKHRKHNCRVNQILII